MGEILEPLLDRSVGLPVGESMNRGFITTLSNIYILFYHLKQTFIIMQLNNFWAPFT